MFRTTLSIVDEVPFVPCVVSVAPDHPDTTMLRQFYREIDAQESDRPDFRPYNGWVPPQTAESIEWVRRAMRG